ncbi:hypothetical protein APHAL10511_006951 [Amanita phalloides]|nr:hypothetical protein APHAL10511_006951 [Amanita phalloides]
MLPHIRTALGCRRLTLSAVQGPINPPLDLRTLPEYFHSAILESNAERPALICRAEKPRGHGGPPSRNMGVGRHLAWDFDELDRHIASLARGLVRMGVKKGDRVGVIMGNNSSYAMLQWACANIGAILVTLNPAYRLHELVSTLNLVSVQHLFVVPSVRKSAYLSTFADAFPALRNSPPSGIQEPALPSLKNLVVVDNDGEFKVEIEKADVRCAVDWREVMIWQDGAEGREVRRIVRGLDKDDVINLQFTSGTTGLPKAVSTRLVLGNLAAWSQSACVVYPSPVYDPPSIVDAIQGERCTALHGVPTHFIGILAEVASRRQAAGIGEGGKLEGFDRLRTGIAAGSPVPIDLMKRLINEMGLTELTNAYGMTETSPVSFQTMRADPIEKQVETVGRVQPHVKAKIVDPASNVVPVGTPGEICIAGYLLQKGYWKDEEQTEKVMKRDEEGTLWMYTGDEGIMDQDGYLRIVGRIKDLIIRGGENLFPVQIENALTADEGILEAAAIAVPDNKFGEVVGAWVVRRPGKVGGALTREAVARVVSERMNPQNTPAWVWFVGEDGVQDELPKTASGKVQKCVLREWSKVWAKKDVGKVL